LPIWRAGEIELLLKDMKTTLKKMWVFSFFALLMVAPTSAHAIAELFVGGLGGQVKSTNGGSAVTTYGGTAGVRILSFGLGAYYLVGEKKGATFGAYTSDIKTTAYGAEPSLFFGDTLTARLGLKLGANKVEGTVTVRGVSVGASDSSFSAGPSAGLDLKFTKFLSIGAEASYIRVFSTSSYGLIAGLGALKFWL
jgi:hypothetical protein